MSNLMQEILSKIEKDAAEASASALKNSGLIYEAEALRDRLHKTGLTSCEPCFHTFGGITFYDHDEDSRMREALAAIGVEIESESYDIIDRQRFNTRRACLTIKGLLCQIWISYDPLPLAEAA